VKVLVECFPDEAILRFLGVPRKRVLHERSKGNVFNRLRNLPGATGMVDEDPGSGQPRDLSSYREIETGEGLRLLARQGSSGQRLIIVCPRLEDWLIHRAALSDVRPEKYGLPSDANRLHSIARYDRKDGFRRFLAELDNRDRGVHLLRRWVLQSEGPDGS